MSVNMTAKQFAENSLMRGTILETSGFRPSFWTITCGYCGGYETASSYEDSEKWLEAHYKEHIEDEKE